MSGTLATMPNSHACEVLLTPSMPANAMAAGNIIIHGDCLNIMPQINTGTVDFILTEPPCIPKYRSRDWALGSERRQCRMARTVIR